jgi:branched-chain amino acid transport system permease protein
VGAYGFAGSRSTQEIVVYFFINLIVAVSLQTFSGNSGLLSFGHMAFVAIGAYTASILTLDPVLKQQEIPGLPSFMETAHLPFITATLIAMLAASCVAVVAGIVLFRLPESGAIIGIFALLLISNAVSGGWTGVTGGGAGIYGMAPFTTVGSALVAASLVVLAARLFRDSSWGIQLRASREDEPAAIAAGIDVRRLRLSSWVLSAAMAGAAGSLLAHRVTAISPVAFFLAPTFIVIAMLVIGGLTTVTGAVVGAMVVTAVREFTRPLEQQPVHIGPLHLASLTGLGEIVLVAMILLSMYFRKEGLSGRLEVDAYFRRRETGQSKSPARLPLDQGSPSAGRVVEERSERDAAL